jgi:cytolysin (calcineurin-like family phosphatase)
MNFLFILALLCGLGALGVMFTGAIGMARGGDFNKKYGNKLMQARVGLQAAAILLLFLAATVD